MQRDVAGGSRHVSAMATMLLLWQEGRWQLKWCWQCCTCVVSRTAVKCHVYCLHVVWQSRVAQNSPPKRMKACRRAEKGGEVLQEVVREEKGGGRRKVEGCTVGPAGKNVWQCV